MKSRFITAKMLILLKQYKGLNFMLPLVESMTLKRPYSRPTAADALKQLDNLVEQQPMHVIKWRIKQVGFDRYDNLFSDLASLGPVGMAYLKERGHACRVLLCEAKKRKHKTCQDLIVTS